MSNGDSSWGYVLAIALVFIVILAFAFVFFPKIKDTIKTGISLVNPYADNKKTSNEESKQNEEWSKILQDYEKNKCQVDKYTCKAINLPCQCFSAEGMNNKQKPETCRDEKHYCYNNIKGCSDKGPDTVEYVDYCQQSNPNFNLNLIPECEIGDRCKVNNPPCKCTAQEGRYEICLDKINSYCNPNKEGCHNEPCRYPK